MFPLVNDIMNLNEDELFEYLQKTNLGLKEEAFKILKKEEIDGYVFLTLTEKKLRSYGIKGGPAIKINQYIKKLNGM